MLNLWVIGLFVIVLMRDSLGAAGIAAPDGAAASGTGPWVWLAGMAPMLAIAGLLQLVMVAVGRMVDRSGSVRALLVAERTLLASRALVLLVHAGNVFVLGWLTEARRLVGDVVLVDELMCVAPPLGVIVAGWWSVYPVERRVREASLMRQIDQNKPVYPVPSRWRYVSLAARHQLSLSLLPIAAISAWAEACDRLISLATRSGWGRLSAALAEESSAGVARVVLQLVGVGTVLIVAPLVVRVVWETTPLSEGTLRSRLAAMCRRHGVRVREILVWRTGGTMINGAVVGMFGRLRYVLLTDALLDSMPRPQVEAVMAHEVAHARLAHMPWLAAVLIATVGCTAAAGTLASGAVWEALANTGLLDATAGVIGAGGTEAVAPSQRSIVALLGLEVIVTACSLLAGLIAFGLVSRRFEWQADAFAAKALSLQPVRGGALRAGDAGVGEAVVAISRIDQIPTVTDPAGSPQTAAVSSSFHFDPTLTPAPEDLPSEPIVHRAAVDAMAGALQSVAALNFIPRHRRSFRHGSIAQRQQRLRRLEGRRLDDLPIDRTVRWIKRTAIVGLLILAALTVWGIRS